MRVTFTIKGFSYTISGVTSLACEEGVLWISRTRPVGMSPRTVEWIEIYHNVGDKIAVINEIR